MNPIRKFIQNFGLDIHRYRPARDESRLWKNLKIKTVLDIGANVGQFATNIREQLPEAQIYSFEPLKECYDSLVETFKTDSNFIAFNYALGEKEEEIEMYKSKYTPSSSLLQMSETHKNLFPHTKEHTPEKIKVRILDEVTKELKLKDQILIKVDVQGFEEKVLNGGKNTFSKARAVILETSFAELYEGQPTFDMLYQKLHALGFDYNGSLQQKIDKETSKVISEDALFVKNS